MQRIKLPLIQGYYLTLNLKGAILNLEIEEESSGKLFSLDIDEESVYEATNGFFETSKGLFQGLKSAANGSYPNIKMTLSNEGITYTGVCSLGAAQSEYGFILKTTEKRVEQVEVIESQLKEKYESEIQKDRETLQLIEASSTVKPPIAFSNEPCYAPNFNLTDNNRTVTLVGEPFFIRSLPQIPSKGQYSYSLRVNQIASGIGFGISSFLNNNEFNSGKEPIFYGFRTYDGKIYGKIQKKATRNGPFGRRDSVLKMIISMDQGILTFFVDNVIINSCSISKSEEYYVFCEIEHAGDSVTLL